MSSGWPVGLQSEQRQHDLVRVIVLLAPQYACARARHEHWLARGPTGERRQHDLVRVIVLLALQYACAHARHELWLARGPTERTTTT